MVRSPINQEVISYYLFPPALSQYVQIISSSFYRIMQLKLKPIWSAKFLVDQKKFHLWFG